MFNLHLLSMLFFLSMFQLIELIFMVLFTVVFLVLHKGTCTWHLIYSHLYPFFICKLEDITQPKSGKPQNLS